jgi:hypothetical protein
VLWCVCSHCLRGVGERAAQFSSHRQSLHTHAATFKLVVWSGAKTQRAPSRRQRESSRLRSGYAICYASSCARACSTFPPFSASSRMASPRDSAMNSISCNTCPSSNPTGGGTAAAAAAAPADAGGGPQS